MLVSIYFYLWLSGLSGIHLSFLLIIRPVDIDLLLLIQYCIHVTRSSKYVRDKFRKMNCKKKC